MSSTDPVVVMRDVGKRYVKFEDVPTMLAGMRRVLKRGRRKQLWAVRHVDLEVKQGDSIGIIGRNGSGKSTTLAMMAGVTAPTEGVVRVRGRVAPLLRLGVGFQPELTGKENVFINGMILGMTMRQIEESFDEIVAFAELEDFMDTPTKFYSTGMNVRLGFASAIAARPELLIVDEVLSVGDIGFQSKSFDRMLEMRERGATLVVVSHNMNAIRRLAERVIVLHDGEVCFHGPTDEAISVYHELMRPGVRGGITADEAAQTAEILSFQMQGQDGAATSTFRAGDEVTFRMRVRFHKQVHDATFGVAISTQSAQWVYGENSFKSGEQEFTAGEEATFAVRVPMNLVSGTYNVTGGVRWGTAVKGSVTTSMIPFYVAGREFVQGIADLQAGFEVEERTAGPRSSTPPAGAGEVVPARVEMPVPDASRPETGQR